MVPAALTRLIVVCGPTAAGKTAASLVLADRLGGEIVAADSRTIYRGMDIGTAKPTPAERARVPHHCLDLADPDEVITLAAYRRAAVEAIVDIRSRGRAPLLVGGTGLYIRAVVDGFTIPAVPPDPMLRARLETEEQHTPGGLHTRLQRVDPLAAARIHPRNIRRLIRALEVFEHTGRPISSLQLRSGAVGEAVQVALTMDRAALYRRIDERVDEQLRAGLLDEVRGLLERGYDPTRPSMQGLGYKEIVAYLQGRTGLDEAIRQLRRNTRRFAKRQYTWFRRDPRVHWLSVDGLTPAGVADAMSRMLE
ncbi:MAG TPA: tRNA (adenosine(37)-N6)-dimethylallyltransferase MiaA [bacterium]|nr:tRNA (adenosine(37)-N6)-dimethylallyltransferase MiaA [bacterium]